MLTIEVKQMEKQKENLEELPKKDQEVIKLYCEYFKEYRAVEEGCKNLKEFCPNRTQCLIYFYSKVKEK